VTSRRIVSEAEQYKAKDEVFSVRITARNGIDSSAHNLRNSVAGDLKDEI